MVESFYSYNQRYTTTKPLILAIDDNEDSLVLLTQILELSGKSVVVAIDGETALTLAKTFCPNLILLDVVLPGMNGFEVLHRLKRNPKTAEIPVVAVTALANADDRAHLLQSGCVDCLSKPFLIDDLETTIDRHLRMDNFVCISTVLCSTVEESQNSLLL